MAVSLKTDLRFPVAGQQRHGCRIIQFALAKAELLAEDFLTVCAPANEVTAAVPADSATLTTAVRRFTYSTLYRSNSHDSELDSAYQMFQFYC